MSAWLRATYSAHEDASESGLGVSRVPAGSGTLRFNRGTLRVRLFAALGSWRLSTGMPGICPF